MLSAERVHLSYLLTLCVTSSAQLLSYRNNPVMEASEGSYHTFLSAALQLSTCLSAGLYFILLSVTAADV